MASTCATASSRRRCAASGDALPPVEPVGRCGTSASCLPAEPAAGPGMRRLARRVREALARRAGGRPGRQAFLGPRSPGLSPSASPPTATGTTTGSGHICLQSLVLLGLAFLASRWEGLSAAAGGPPWRSDGPSTSRLGIALQFAVEDFAFDRWLNPGRNLGEIAQTYAVVTQENLSEKIIAHSLILPTFCQLLPRLCWRSWAQSSAWPSCAPAASRRVPLENDRIQTDRRHRDPRVQRGVGAARAFRPPRGPLRRIRGLRLAGGLRERRQPGRDRPTWRAPRACATPGSSWSSSRGTSGSRAPWPPASPMRAARTPP
jgi:hypothetical protein